MMPRVVVRIIAGPGALLSRVPMTKGNKMATQMRLLSGDGVISVRVEVEQERSALGAYWNAVSQFLATGDDKPLIPFARVSIAGHALLTDLDAVERWAAEGELEFEDIYNASDR